MEIESVPGAVVDPATRYVATMIVEIPKGGFTWTKKPQKCQSEGLAHGLA